MKEKRTVKLRRVDYQVTIITALILIVSFLCSYFVTYQITHDDMIYTLKERSESIYEFVDDYVDKSTFYSDAALSMNDTSYQNMKMRLEEVRKATNVRYIYTAGINEDGDYIYLVDGLPSDSSDFRKPGDMIETEIIPEMKQALNNKTIMPDKIKSTAWGKIFVTYFPIHDQEKVVGVLGIEFDANHQYEAFQSVQNITFMIGIVACIIAAILAVLMFKRISNPLFKDMKNTDYLTHLKSRNAFEIDMQNFDTHRENVGFIVVDMNDLKTINDLEGHYVGDKYIMKTAQVLIKALPNRAIYRYGGDEFVALCFDVVTGDLDKDCQSILSCLQEMNGKEQLEISLSMGYAYYDCEKDQTLQDTFKRADRVMYEQKKEMKKGRDV